MTGISKNLEQLTFHIPNLWDQNWTEAIESAEEPEKTILLIQKRAGLVLKRIGGFQVTFARLGWLNIWSKAFSALEGTLCALAKDSIYLLRILTRTTFELELHLQTIMRPVLDRYYQTQKCPSLGKKEREAAATNRLEAYAGWCIWNDRLHYKNLLKPDTLKAIWDPGPALQILNDSDASLLHEAVFGKLDVETDERELKKGLLIQQNAGHYRIHRYETWLNHPVLFSWHEKLKSLAGHEEKHFVSFFNLVEGSRSGVKKELENQEIPFAYPLYNEASLAIHGSTMDQFLNLGEEKIFPIFFGQPDETLSVALQIGKRCNHIVVGLLLLKDCTGIWGIGEIDSLPQECF